MPAGFPQQFCAVGLYQGIHNDDVDIEVYPRDITGDVLWSSSQLDIGAISEGGLVSTYRPGTTMISASVANPEVEVGHIPLQVTAPLLESISIDPPLLSATVPGAVTPFTCTGGFSNDACSGSNPELCDVTPLTQWSSLNPGVATVGNAPVLEGLNQKGLMSALVPGVTDIRCQVINGRGDTVSATATPVRVCDAQLLSQPQGLQLMRSGAPVGDRDFLRILPEQTIPLSLVGTFQNNDPACGTVGETFSLDLTDSAQWSSSSAAVITVGDRVQSNKGVVRFAAPGLAQARAQFAGVTVAAQVVGVDARVERVEVTGPRYLLTGGNYTFEAAAFYTLADPDGVAGLPAGCAAVEGDSGQHFACPVTNSPHVVWTASLESGEPAHGVGEFPSNDGQLTVPQDVSAQVVSITAQYLGRTGHRDGLVVPATLRSVQVTPSLACLSSGTLGLNALIGSATQKAYRADHVYDISLDGGDTTLTCAIDGTEASSWSIPVDTFAGNFGNGSDLLTLLGLNQLLGLSACQPLLPVGVTDNAGGDGLLSTAPAFVSNQEGQRGLVTANDSALLGLIPNLTVGTACVQARTGEHGGQGTVLVATDILPEACELLSPLTEALLADGPAHPSCESALDALTGQANEENAAADASSGFLGLLLGPLAALGL